MNNDISLNPNHLVSFLNKPARDFTKKDLIRFVKENSIKMINFRYVAEDGRLKNLNFIINSERHLDYLLSTGERVDGSSLFSFIKASSSDLYVIPRYKTAFVNPFTQIPSMDVLCSFYTNEGKPLESSPENIVRKAHKLLQAETGFTYEVLGELEYYLFSEVDSIYPIIEQKGYHESHPFSKWAMIRREAMKVISEIGGEIKYGHAEVGNIINDDIEMVQHEIEFLPVQVEEAADHLVLAKWAVREIAYKYGLEVSFAPKIIVGHAGNGLHIHSRLVKDNQNMLVKDNKLSEVAKKLITGLLELSPSLTAFGNTVPTSFLRLVPHQEAPTNICWGDRNRSVLVRVPLGWLGVEDMIHQENPQEPADDRDFINGQTVEFRSPDGSANVHFLLAGMTIAALHGLQSPNSLKLAEKLYICDEASELKELNQLPSSCYEAAEFLVRDRKLYEKNGIFPSQLIDKISDSLKSYNDKDMSEKMFGKGDALKKIVEEYIHCG